MKRFFWIPFLLLLTLFTATLVNAAVAGDLVENWCASLDDLQRSAQTEDWPTVRDSLAALHESWDARTASFNIVLQHYVLNDVEALLAKADIFAAEQDEEELRACIAELRSQLLVLSEIQKISVKNIL